MTRRNRRSRRRSVVQVGEHLGDAGHVVLGEDGVVVAVRELVRSGWPSGTGAPVEHLLPVRLVAGRRGLDQQAGVAGLAVGARRDQRCLVSAGRAKNSRASRRRCRAGPRAGRGSCRRSRWRGCAHPVDHRSPLVGGPARRPAGRRRGSHSCPNATAPTCLLQRSHGQSEADRTEVGLGGAAGGEDGGHAAGVDEDHVGVRRGQRPSAALPSRPARPLPVYVRSRTQPPRPPPSASRRHRLSVGTRVVVAEPVGVELHVATRRRDPHRLPEQAPACRRRARRCRGCRSRRPSRRRSPGPRAPDGRAIASSARPATRPAWVPPLDDVCTIGGRLDARSRRTAPSARRTRRAYRRAPVGVLPPIGIEYGAAPSAASASVSGIARRSQLAPVAVVGTRVVQLGAEQRRQQLVAGRRVGPVARQHQMDLEPEHGAGGRGHPAVVRLRGADGHERAGAGRQRLAAQELELARLVAAHAEPGEVVALDPQPPSARQLGPPLQRCRQQSPAMPGEVTEHVTAC